MFGDVAVTLLKMAGHTGTVPGTLLAGDIRPALARLKQAIAVDDPNGISKNNASLNTEDVDRPSAMPQLPAYTLIELLIAAARQDCEVRWEH